MSQPPYQPPGDQSPKTPPPVNPPVPPPAGPPPVTGQPVTGQPVVPTANPYVAPQQLGGRAEIFSNVTGNFTQARTGIGIVYYGLNVVALGIFCIVGIIVANLFAFQGQKGGENLIFIGGAITLIGIVLMFVGPFFCMTTPRESGTRPFAILSVLLSCASILLLAFAIISAAIGGLNFMSDNLILLGYSPMLSSLLGMAGTLCFVAFLGKLAAYLGRRGLVWLAVVTGVAYLYLAVMPLVILVIGIGVGANIDQPQGPMPGGEGVFSGVMIFLSCGTPVAALVGLLTYVNLLRALKKHLAAPQFQG